MELLRRYTNLSAALRILQTKKITLLSSENWDDVNDRRLLEVYRRKSNFKSVLCLCFAKQAETYHHWKVFAPGTDGICIVFDKKRLLKLLPETVAHKEVSYYTVSDLYNSPPGVHDLPFSKRIAYKDEKEFRLLWVSETEEIRAKEFDISVDAIDRLIINPWLPSNLADAISKAFLGTKDFHSVDVVRSTITDGPSWRRFAEGYK